MSYFALHIAKYCKKPLAIILIAIFSISSCPKQLLVERKIFLQSKKTSIILSNDKMSHTKKNGITTINYFHHTIGKFIDIINSKDESALTVYQYKGYINSINMHLLEVKHYESIEQLLVSNTGNRYELTGQLYLSPDNKYLVVISQGLEYELLPNGIQIFSLHTGRLEKICNLKMSKEEPQDIRWIGNSGFVLKCQKMSSDGIPANSFSYKKFVY